VFFGRQDLGESAGKTQNLSAAISHLLRLAGLGILPSWTKKGPSEGVPERPKNKVFRQRRAEFLTLQRRDFGATGRCHSDLKTCVSPI
jgi:hypothetical protein